MVEQQIITFALDKTKLISLLEFRLFSSIMKRIFLPADVNECELLGNVCGEAICENHEGSYLCLCPDETQEFDRNSGKCFSTPPGNVVYCKSTTAM